MPDQYMEVLRPDAKPGDAPILRLRMTDVYVAEGRRHEVATVNAQKAPELLCAFNQGYAAVGDLLGQVAGALISARKAARDRRSVVLLDVVPRVLREKQLASARSPGGSEDQREAILDADAEYSRCRDVVDLLEAVEEVLANKRKSLEMDYNSVKKVLGAEPAWAPAGVGRNRNLSAGPLPEGAEAGTSLARSAFGVGGV